MSLLSNTKTHKHNEQLPRFYFVPSIFTMPAMMAVITKKDDELSEMQTFHKSSIEASRLTSMAEEIEEIEKNADQRHSLMTEPNNTLRKKIHYCCTDPHSSRLALIWEWTLAVLIFASIAFYAVETFCTKPVHRPGTPSLEAFAFGELFFTIMFTGELVVRCAVSPLYFTYDEDSLDRDPPFFRDPLNLLDFVAVMPLFLETIFQPPTGPTALNLEFEIIKLLRVLRVFKIFRSFSGTAILMETAAKSMKPLSLTMMMLFMFFTVVASMVFMLEPCTSADCTFKDVYNTGYFLAITLTTVGYGDQIPTHAGARFLAIVTMMFGAVFLSMPIAVIGNKFEAAYNNFEKRQAHKNPALALENAKKDYKNRLEHRRKRITHGMFSMLYDLQRVEVILDKVKNGIVDTPSTIMEEEVIKNEKNLEVPPMLSSEKEKPLNTAANLLMGKQSKYSVRNRQDPNTGRAKVMEGPVAEALTHLSRKHHFVSIDIRQLFRTNRVDKSLPIHIQQLMKKITQIDSMDNVEEEEEKEEKEAPEDSQITQEASSGVQAFDLVQKNANRFEMQASIGLAKKRNTCRDKIWLLLEAHSSSRCSYRVYMFRWLVLGLSVMVMMLSTWPNFYIYGEDSAYCQRLVVSYCQKISSSTSPNKAAWVASNPGCFPATAESLNVSVTNDYKGCLSKETCDFPSAAHNMTCGFGSMFTGCDSHPNACTGRLDRQNSIYTHLKDGILICDRTPCVDNVNVPKYYKNRSTADYSSLWGMIETLLVAYFVMEYFTRLFVARDFKKFFRAHLANLFFTLLLVLEFILVITSRSGWKYDAWGMNPFDTSWDTHTMRPLRIIVPLRFVAFSSDFRGIRVAVLTLERVAGRMMTPFLFFIVFMVLFAGIMYVFELLECKAMEVPDGTGNLKWFYMNKNEEDDCMVQDMFDAMWIIIVT